MTDIGVRPTATWLVLVALIALPATAAELLVADFSGNKLSRFDASTGTFINDYVPAGSGGLFQPHAAVIGPDGHLYVGALAGNVYRYDTTTSPTAAPLPGPQGTAGTAQFLRPGGGGLGSLGGLAFGPDGNLYVSDLNADRIFRFNGSTGAFIDIFVGAGSGGLSGAELLVFGSDGHLYICSFDNSAVLRYDGTSGAPLPGPNGAPGTAEFVTPGLGGLLRPHDLAFGPGGDLYVASTDTGTVIQYDGTTGSLVSVLVPAVTSPHGIAFGFDANIYTSSLSNPLIPRFDGASGASLGTFVNGTGIFSNGSDLLFLGVAAPPPVPDGNFGSAMTASKLDPMGNDLQVVWDVTTCLASDYHILFGDLPIVDPISVSGAECGLGTSGTFSWLGTPATGELWFLVVGSNGDGTEGSWGTDSDSDQRGGTMPSGECANLSRDNTASCP